MELLCDSETTSSCTRIVVHHKSNVLTFTPPSHTMPDAVDWSS